MDATAGALRTQRDNRSDLAIAALAIAAVAVTLILRIMAARGSPLTIDETFTGMIASQHRLPNFIREARRDVAAPLYYTLLWLLPHGSTDVALRLPSWAFMLGASGLPLVWRIPGQSRSAAIAWAALLFLWLPGAIFANQARPYALLFLLATAQTVAFARLVEAPSLRRAFVWTTSCSLSILAHYFSAPLGLAQGLILLAVMGRKALPLWPALLVVAIPVVEAVTHLRALSLFASSDANWLPPITFANLHNYLIYGLGAFGPVLMLIALGSRYLDRSEEMPRAPALASIAGAMALLMLIAAGWHRSLLVDRYLTSCAPALMLAVITVSAGIGARLLIVGVAAALAIYTSALIPVSILERSIEWSANQLIPGRPARVVYSLGYSGQHTLAPETRKELGEYLFRREGLPTKAEMVATVDGRELARAAGDDAAIMWSFYPEAQPVANAIARERHCSVAPLQLACPPLDAAKR